MFLTSPKKKQSKISLKNEGLKVEGLLQSGANVNSNNFGW